jgi:hypothetical protein
MMSATCSDRSRPSIPIDVGRVASARWWAVVWHLCVGDGRLADDVVPAVDRYLAIAQRRTSPALAA